MDYVHMCTYLTCIEVVAILTFGFFSLWFCFLDSSFSEARGQFLCYSHAMPLMISRACLNAGRVSCLLLDPHHSPDDQSQKMRKIVFPPSWLKRQISPFHPWYRRFNADVVFNSGIFLYTAELFISLRNALGCASERACLFAYHQRKTLIFFCK